MDRISRQQMFLEITEVAARRSTCFRGNTGALIVRPDGHLPLSLGYNGPPSGEPHCQGNACETGLTGGCLRSVHAEQNAIERALRVVGDVMGCDMYSTLSPCPKCALLIGAHGIRRVFYRNPYRMADGIEKLHGLDVEVYKVTPAGFIVRDLDGKLIDPASL